MLHQTSGGMKCPITLVLLHGLFLDLHNPSSGTLMLEGAVVLDLEQSSPPNIALQTHKPENLKCKGYAAL